MYNIYNMNTSCLHCIQIHMLIYTHHINLVGNKRGSMRSLCCAIIIGCCTRIPCMTPTEQAYHDMRNAYTTYARMRALQTYCSALRTKYGYYTADTDLYFTYQINDDITYKTYTVFDQIPTRYASAYYPRTVTYWNAQWLEERKFIPLCLVEIQRIFHGYSRQLTQLKRKHGLHPYMSEEAGPHLQKFFSDRRKNGLPLLNQRTTHSWIEYYNGNIDLEPHYVDADINMVKISDAKHLLRTFFTSDMIPEVDASQSLPNSAIIHMLNTVYSAEETLTNTSNPDTTL